jgi:cobalt-zinc-cadmium efflux system outer membrane protein
MFETSTSQTPMRGRNFWFLAVALGALTPVPALAEPLTDQTVVRLARERDPALAVANEAVAVAAAGEVQAGLFPNPQLEYEREHLPSNGEAEDSLALSVPIDLSSERRTRRALARADAADARSLAAFWRSEAVAAALTTYYEAIAAAKRVSLAAENLARLKEALRVLERRRDEGTASGYDEHRVAVEAEFAKTDLEEARALALVLKRELALRLTLEEDAVELQGELALRPKAASRGPASPSSRPAIRHVREAMRETSRARDASDGAWLPTVSVKGGVLRHQAGEASYGFLAGVTVSLPIFSRGQGVRAEADARLKLARARVSAREREARLEVTRAQVELELAQRELVRFQSATRGRIERLEKAAQSSYREGRRTVLELLDAQRTRSAVQERLLELALAAKRAEIALRAARGEFE